MFFLHFCTFFYLRKMFFFHFFQGIDTFYHFKNDEKCSCPDLFFLFCSRFFSTKLQQTIRIHILKHIFLPFCIILSHKIFSLLFFLLKCSSSLKSQFGLKVTQMFKILTIDVKIDFLLCSFESTLKMFLQFLKQLKIFFFV